MEVQLIVGQRGIKKEEREGSARPEIALTHHLNNGRGEYLSKFIVTHCNSIFLFLFRIYVDRVYFYFLTTVCWSWS